MFGYIGGLHCSRVFSLAVASVALISLACTPRLLIALTPLAASTGADMGSAVLISSLSCPMACGIFTDQGWNLRPSHWQVDSQPLDHQGKFPRIYF